MKRAKTLGFILFSFLISSYAVIRFKNDLTKQNLKGSVKYILETKFIPNIKFGEVKSWDKQFTNDYLYNGNGNLDEENDYGSLGGLAHKTKYKYDNSFKLIDKNDYKYDGSLSFRFSYKYVDVENLILIDWFESDGRLYRKFIQKYDDKGNLIKISAYSSEGKLDAITTYKYNEMGLQIQEDGLGHLVFKYDENNNLIEQVNSAPATKVIYTYELYDKVGNWLKKTEFIDGIPTEMIERKIEYY